MTSTRARWGAAALVLGLSGGLSAAVTSPADALVHKQADKLADKLAKKCVSQQEYGQIAKNQTMSKVHSIVDNQKVFYGYNAVTDALEQYETCGWSQKYVTIKYGGDIGSPLRVRSKSLKPFQGSTS